VNEGKANAKRGSGTKAAAPVRESAEPKDPLFVTALARGLEILRCFTPDQQDLGTSQIARLTGLPQPTVWRLCNTLSHLGYLVPGRTPDRLRVGAGVLMLGHAAITHTGISEFALPLMRQVAEEFEASVSLAERDRMGMVIVQRSEATSILRVNLHIGSSLELSNSSLGWAYLAGLDPATRAKTLIELRKHNSLNWDKVAKDIEQAMAEYARYGLVFNLGKSHRDINAIGVPVSSPDGSRVMALTCGGAKSSLRREKLLGRVGPALKDLARKIGPLLSQDSEVR
jgi:DNA-binding IclR family transcriptional regulator